MLGSQVSLLALPLTALLVLHAKAFQVGLLASLETLPFLLIGLPMGVWIERVRRRPVLVATASVRAVVLASVPVLWVLGWLSLVDLDAVALAVGFLSAVFDITWQAYLPSFVGRSRLHQANARLSMSSSGAQLAGPGLAGVLAGALSAPVAVLVDALGFLGAALSLGSIRRSEATPAEGERRALGEGVREGLGFVLRHPHLRRIAACTAAFNMVAAALNVVLVVFEAQVLHLSAGMIGVVFFLGNLGFLVGASLIRPVASRLGIGPTIVVAACLMAVAPVLLPLARAGFALPVLVAGWFVRAVGSPVYGANQVSFRLAITPPRLLARMTATMKFFVMGAMPAGSLLAGALGSTIGLRSTLWVVAGFSVVSLATVVTGGLRSVRTSPEALRPREPSSSGPLRARRPSIALEAS